MISNSLKKLKDYIEKNEYKGFDPYDGLTSPLFKLPFFKTNKTIKLYFQQFIKRFPLNLRSLFIIKRGYNPVTLGLCIQAYTYLLKNSEFSIHHSELIKKIDFLIDELERLQSKDYSGICWGYDFDWQSSTVSIPAFGPTIVATGIITNALFEFYVLSGNEKAKELILSSVDFVLKDLNRTQPLNYRPSSLNHLPFCFSYSPFDKESVYNANMKAVRLLTQVYSITKTDNLLSEAKNALKFVLDNQNEDGSWYYSNRISDKRVDNYHTGYVLECLKTFIELTGDNSPSYNLRKGYEFYLNNFINQVGAPKFYHDNLYPVDSTSGAQTIIALCKFGNIDLAEKVAQYMIKNMQSSDGFFYFRKYKNITNRISFMRWSNAWMFLALNCLISELNK